MRRDQCRIAGTRRAEPGMSSMAVNRIAALALLPLLALEGCATGPAAGSSAAKQNANAGTDTSAAPPAQTPFPLAQGWWYVRFRLTWPDGADPAWYRDLLLADRVARPALVENRDAISLWRFHRRAARDAAGHQFSFIFRSSPATAARVYAEIRSNPTLRELQRRQVVTLVTYDDLSRIDRPGIADTSDATWSPQMQTAWPAFIMGVSELWLELIDAIDRKGTWPAGLDARYRTIDASLNKLWQTEGSHALLHHLNALFGYQPVIVTTRAPMRF